MKPGDLVQFIEPEKNGLDIMIVLQITDNHEASIDVFCPTEGIQTYSVWLLKVISDNHEAPQHAKLTALAFAGSCSTRKQGECQ